MTDATDGAMLAMIKNVVEENGCRIIDIDLDNRVINLEGAESDQVRCALAIQKLIDG